MSGCHISTTWYIYKEKKKPFLDSDMVTFSEFLDVKLQQWGGGLTANWFYIKLYRFLTMCVPCLFLPI